MTRPRFCRHPRVRYTKGTFVQYLAPYKWRQMSGLPRVRVFMRLKALVCPQSIAYTSMKTSVQCLLSLDALIKSYQLSRTIVLQALPHPPHTPSCHGQWVIQSKCRKWNKCISDGKRPQWPGSRVSLILPWLWNSGRRAGSRQFPSCMQLSMWRGFQQCGLSGGGSSGNGTIPVEKNGVAQREAATK